MVAPGGAGRHSTRTVAVGLSVVALVAAVAVPALRAGDSPQPSVQAEPVAAAYADWSRIAACGMDDYWALGSPRIALPGWRRLPSPPVDGSVVAEVGGALATWSGSALAIYDAGTWRCPDTVPVKTSEDATIAWTGTRLLVWGDGSAAVLDPATGAWRQGAASPEAVGQAAATVWTGRELVVYGDDDRSAPSARARAYDPATDRWRTLAYAPRRLNHVTGVWTGREVVLVGAESDGDNQDQAGTAAIAFDPASMAWRELPAPPLSPQASTVAWTGEELVAWDYLLQAATLDPEDGDRRELPAVGLRPRECFPSSTAVTGGVVAGYCDQAARLDMATRTWTPLHLPAAGVEQLAAWNGGAAVVLDLDGAALGPRELWRLDPALAASRPAVTSLRLRTIEGFAEASLPAGWYAARETLTPLLSGPLEVLTVTTVAAPQAGVNGGSSCAHVPDGAVEQLGPRDALVTFQAGAAGDRGALPYGEVPALPDDPELFGFSGCFANADALELHWLTLAADKTPGGHYVMVAMGDEVSATRRAEVLAVLNAFRPLR